jgi:hypothetical protein
MRRKSESRFSWKVCNGKQKARIKDPGFAHHTMEDEERERRGD